MSKKTKGRSIGQAQKSPEETERIRKIKEEQKRREEELRQKQSKKV